MMRSKLITTSLSRSSLKKRTFATAKTSTTLGQAFEDVVAAQGHRDSLIATQQQLRWTFNELKTHVDAFANGLIDARFPPSSTVAVLLNNEVESVVTQLATTKAGFRAVTFNPSSSVEEIKKLLLSVNARGVLLSSKFQTKDKLLQLFPELGDWEEFETVDFENFPALKYVIYTEQIKISGGTQFRDIIQYERLIDLVPDQLAKVKSEDVAIIANNTTSLNHSNVLSLARDAAKSLELEVGTRIVNLLPYYTPQSYILGIWAPILSGSVVVIPSPQFKADEVLKSIHTEKPSILVGDESQFNALLSSNSLKRFNLSSIQKAVLVGSQADKSPVSQQLNNLGIKTVIPYKN